MSTKYLLMLIIVGLIVSGLALWDKKPSAKRDTEKLSVVAKRQDKENKRIEPMQQKANDSDNAGIPLEVITENSTVMEPEATRLWNLLQTIGLHDEKSLAVLDAFFSTHANRKYYKELIAYLKRDDLPDKIRAKIIYLLAAAYDGGKAGMGKRLYEPINEKDVEIQRALRDEIDDPKGSASIEEALGYIYLVADDGEIQQILSDFLDKKSRYISKEKIYEYKLLNGSMAFNKEIILGVLKELESLPKTMQSKLAEKIANTNYAFGFSRFQDDAEIVQSYTNLLKKYPPKLPYEFNEAKLSEKFKERFEAKVPVGLDTDMEKAEYLFKHHKDEGLSLYQELEDKASRSFEKYADWIEAQALMVRDERRYDFYRQKLLEVSKIERRAILSRLETKAKIDYDEEAQEYLKRFKEDAQLQDILENYYSD